MHKAHFLNLKKSLGFIDRPDISVTNGKFYGARDIDDMLIEASTHWFNESKELFPSDVKNVENIEENYQCFRNFRRSATTRALEKKVA